MPRFNPTKSYDKVWRGPGSRSARKIAAPSIVFIIFVALVLLLILVVLNELFGWSLFTGWSDETPWDGENEDGENMGGSISKRFSLY